MDIGDGGNTDHLSILPRVKGVALRSGGAGFASGGAGRYAPAGVVASLTGRLRLHRLRGRRKDEQLIPSGGPSDSNHIVPGVTGVPRGDRRRLESFDPEHTMLGRTKPHRFDELSPSHLSISCRTTIQVQVRGGGNESP